MNKKRKRDRDHHICVEFVSTDCDEALVEPNHSFSVRKHIDSPHPRRKFLYGEFKTDISSSNTYYPTEAVAVDGQEMAHNFVSYDAGDEFSGWLF